MCEGDWFHELGWLRKMNPSPEEAYEGDRFHMLGSLRRIESVLVNEVYTVSVVCMLSSEI